jgi:hypothetical protein
MRAAQSSFLCRTNLSRVYYSRDYLIRHAMRGETNVIVEILGNTSSRNSVCCGRPVYRACSPLKAMLIRTSQPLINTNEIIVGTITAGYCSITIIGLSWTR